MTDRIIIIPSARLVPIELQAEFGPISSAMIPVDGRPALHHLLAGYPTAVEALIAIHEGGEEVSSYIDHHLDDRAMTAVDVGSTGSLGETILRSLESLTELPQQLIINFADTILSDSSTAASHGHGPSWITCGEAAPTSSANTKPTATTSSGVTLMNSP